MGLLNFILFTGFRIIFRKGNKLHLIVHLSVTGIKSFTFSLT